MDQYQIISNFKAGNLKLLYDVQEEENTPKNLIHLSLRYFFFLLCICPNSCQQKFDDYYCDFPINQALNPKALCFAFYYYFQKIFPEHFDELNLYDIYPFESYSPLMLACKFNHLEMVRYLLNSGVDVNLVVGYLYKDALTCAIISGSKEIVNTLLAHGARLNDKHISHVIAINNFELLQILISNSAIVNESQIQEALNWGFNLQKFDEVINFLLNFSPLTHEHMRSIFANFQRLSIKEKNNFSISEAIQKHVNDELIRCCLFEAISFENDAYLTFILQYFNFDEKVWYEIGLDKKNILKAIRILMFWGDDKKIQGFIKFHTQHQKFLLDELRFEWKSILNSLLNASLLIPGVCRYILIRISQTLHLIGEPPQKNQWMFFSFGDKQKVEVEFEKLEMRQQPN